jgi:hypothetical protein
MKHIVAKVYENKLELATSEAFLFVPQYGSRMRVDTIVVTGTTTSAGLTTIVKLSGQRVLKNGDDGVGRKLERFRNPLRGELPPEAAQFIIQAGLSNAIPVQRAADQ